MQEFTSDGGAGSAVLRVILAIEAFEFAFFVGQALLGAASGCELVIYDLAGEVLTRAPLPRAPYAVAWSPDGRELLVSMPDATDSQVSRYLVRR